MKFKKLSEQEMKGIETRLSQKKLKFVVKDGLIKRKVGNKSGKTQYQLFQEEKDELMTKRNLTLLQFCKLYNEEMELLGVQGLYTKIVRNEMVLNYMYNKGWIRIKESKRIRDGILQGYTNYWFKGSLKEVILDFFVKYRSTSPIDNESAIRELIKRNPTAIKNPEKLESRVDYRVKTGNIIKVSKKIKTQ